MSEGLPVGWTARPVGEAGEVLLGRQRSPDQMTGQHPTPYLRVANVLDGHIDYSDVLTMNFTPTERAVYGLRPGDILLNEGQSLDLVGRSSIYDGPPDTYCYQNTLVRFRPKPGLRSKYAQAVFSRWVRQRTLTQIAKQTTSIAHLGASRFAALMFPEPPEQEQQRIAEILDALDRAIRASEQVITKLEMLKRGLLYDLLTLGVDENGEVRDPGRNRSDFMSTPLGLIPKTWRADPMASLLADGPRNGMYKPAASIGDGVLMVGQTAITHDDYVDYRTARRARTTKAEAEQYGLRDGDILVTRVFAVVSGVGRSVLVMSPPEPTTYESNLMRIRTNERAIPEWLFLAMKTPPVRQQVQASVNASNQASINRTALNAVILPVPPQDEQFEMVRRMRAAELQVHAGREALHKLSLLRHGLTDDLLTGRVRVLPHPR